MRSRRVNPNVVKRHYSYTVQELAACLGVHKNTVRNWQAEGMAPIDGGRPVLFHGSVVREFLARRNADRKRPCAPGTLYCLRCRQPRPPALDMVEFVSINATSGNLRAICSHCEAMIHRRARKADLAAIMPGFTVQIAERPFSLSGRAPPSLNCDSEKES